MYLFDSYEVAILMFPQGLCCKCYPPNYCGIQELQHNQQLFRAICWLLLQATFQPIFLAAQFTHFVIMVSS